MSETDTKVKVTITNPIHIDGKPVTELSFREPLLSDLIYAEEMAEGNLAQTAYTLVGMCDAEHTEFTKLTGSDFKLILDKCSKLLGNG